MSRKVFQKKEMDEIERRLISSANLENEKIEEIISNPRLFSSVLLKIEEEKKLREQKSSHKNWFGLPELNWRISLAFGLSVLFIAALSSLFIFRSSDSLQDSLAENIDSSKPLSLTVPITQLTPQPVNAPDSFNSPDLITEPKRNHQRAIVKTDKKISSKSASIKETEPRLAKSDDTEEFYPLIFAGDLNDTDDDRRIIRVELTKESLASLGVDIPVMNENEKIKSDLLIGSDGVPQAIRFVKNSKNNFKKVRKYEKGS